MDQTQRQTDNNEKRDPNQEVCHAAAVERGGGGGGTTLVLDLRVSFNSHDCIKLVDAQFVSEEGSHSRRSERERRPRVVKLIISTQCPIELSLSCQEVSKDATYRCDMLATPTTLFPGWTGEKKCCWKQGSIARDAPSERWYCSVHVYNTGLLLISGSCSVGG